MLVDWYTFLKVRIGEVHFSDLVESAFYQGQVAFASKAGLISDDQYYDLISFIEGRSFYGK